MKNKVMSLKDRGLTEDILSKLVIEYDESSQSSMLGTVYMSKRRLLVIQSKIWNDKPNLDFRIWYKDEDDYFKPSRKGFMIALSHTKGDGVEVFPLRDFVNIFKGILTLPNEKEANGIANESCNLTTKMLEGIVSRGACLTKPQIDKTSKRAINQFIYNPLDTEFIAP